MLPFLEEADRFQRLGRVLDDDAPGKIAEGGLERGTQALLRVERVGNSLHPLPLLGRRQEADAFRKAFAAVDQPLQEIHACRAPLYFTPRLQHLLLHYFDAGGHLLAKALRVIIAHLGFGKGTAQLPVFRAQAGDLLVEPCKLFLIRADLFRRVPAPAAQMLRPGLHAILLPLALGDSLDEGDGALIECLQLFLPGFEGRFERPQLFLHPRVFACGMQFFGLQTGNALAQGGSQDAEPSELRNEARLLPLQALYRRPQGTDPFGPYQPLLLHVVRLFAMQAHVALGFRKPFFHLKDGQPERLKPRLPLGETHVGVRTAAAEQPHLFLHRPCPVEEVRVLPLHQIDLKLPQAGLQGVVLLRLPRLALQRGDRFLHFGHDVVDTGQIGPDVVQLTVGSFAPVFVLGHPGSFLEQPPPLIRLVAQDGLDHLEFNDRVRIAPHAGIHEEVEDVFETAGDLVQEILALAGAVDPAADRHLGVFRRKYASGVLDHQRRLRHAEGLALLGAVEDDILHLVAAEGAVALLAEHPADGIDDVGLAAAVRPDDRGDPAVEHQVHLLGERLEADNFKL